MISLVLIPIFLVMQGTLLYFFIFIIACSFGLIFNALANDIENINYKHHVTSGLLIPAFAIINMYFIAFASDSFNKIYQLTSISETSPIIAGIVYAISFALPYALTKYIGYVKSKKK